MGAALRLVDETTTGEVLGEVTLRLASERLTVRELLEARVRQEVAAFNACSDENLFRGLVQPTEAEAELNGYRVKRGKQVDADAQIGKACEAFESNGFLLLVDDEQLETLDDEFFVSPKSKISFIKLVPLVGG